jgi:hypothetical protein
LKDNPVMEARQSAIAFPARAIVPESPDGTKVITSGLSGEPRAPAFTVGGFAINGQLGVGRVAVGAVVGATVGGTAVGGTAVGGTAVGAWVAGAIVGAVVAWAQELNTSELKTITESNTNRIFFFTFFLLIMDKKIVALASAK